MFNENFTSRSSAVSKVASSAIFIVSSQVASHRKLEHILVLLNKYKNNVAVLEQALKNLFTLHRNRVDLGYSSAHIEPQLFEVGFKNSTSAFY